MIQVSLGCAWWGASLWPHICQVALVESWSQSEQGSPPRPGCLAAVTLVRVRWWGGARPCVSRGFCSGVTAPRRGRPEVQGSGADCPRVRLGRVLFPPSVCPPHPPPRALCSNGENTRARGSARCRCESSVCWACTGMGPPAGGSPAQRPAQRLCALSGGRRPAPPRGRAGAQLTRLLAVPCIPLDRQGPLHPGGEQRPERRWRRGEWGPGIRSGVPRTPSSRPPGDGRLPLARPQGCSGLALLHACALRGAGSQPPPWCRVEPQQEDPERTPGSGQALRRGGHGNRPGPGLFPVCLSALFREQSSMLGFSFPSESRFL